MPHLIQLLSKNKLLKYGIEGINFLSSTLNQVVVTLIYNQDNLFTEFSSMRNLIKEHIENYILINGNTNDFCKYYDLINDENFNEEKSIQLLKDFITDFIINKINEILSNSLKKFVIIIRYKNKKIIVGKNNYIIEKLVLNKGNPLLYKQIDDGFSNPNTIVNMKALDWICKVVEQYICPPIPINLSNNNAVHSRSDLLEMYCGNGNHTVALSSYFNKIFAVEINNKLCKIARKNFLLNNKKNIKILACDSSHFANKILRNLNNYPKSHKVFQEIEEEFDDEIVDEVFDSSINIPETYGDEIYKNQIDDDDDADADDGSSYYIVEGEEDNDLPTHNNFDLSDSELGNCYNFRTVLVDPPRAGLDKFTIKAIQNYDFIIYISCNPTMLLENLKEVSFNTFFFKFNFYFPLILYIF